MTRSKNYRIYSFVLFVFLFFGAAVHADNTDIGIVTFVDGTVRKMTSGSEGWLTVEVGTAIAVGDSIKTIENSKVEFTLRDNGTFRMGPQSGCIIEIDFSRTSIYPDLSYGDIWADLKTKGQNDVRGMTRLMLPAVEINSNQAVARFVAGTDCTSEMKCYKYDFIASRREWYGLADTAVLNGIKNYRCQPDSTMPDSLSKWIEELVQGQKLISSSRGYVIFKSEFSPDDPDEATDWVRWNLERDREIQKNKK